MKKGLKKLIALSTVAAMTFSLAACGNSSEGSSANSGSSTSASSKSSGSTSADNGTYKVALIHQHMANSFHIAVSEGAEAKAKELGIELMEFDSDKDAQTQISQIEQCISEGYDVIGFEPVDPDGLVDAAKQVMDAGITCLNFSSTITGWDEIINGYVGASNVAAGELEMSKVAEMIGGEGEIAILTGPEGDSGGLLRYEGYEKVLAEYPDISIVAQSACDWDTALAQATVESWKVAYPEIKAIVSENDGMAVGAGNVYGADSGVIITGIDASADGLEAIGDGRQTGSVAQDAHTQGGLFVQLAYDFCTGEASGIGVESVCENIWVDAENLEAYKNGELTE